MYTISTFNLHFVVKAKRSFVLRKIKCGHFSNEIPIPIAKTMLYLFRSAFKQDTFRIMRLFRAYVLNIVVLILINSENAGYPKFRMEMENDGLFLPLYACKQHLRYQFIRQYDV